MRVCVAQLCVVAFPVPAVVVDSLLCDVVEGSDPLQDSIRLVNRSPRALVYRVRVSVQNKFIIKSGEGVIEGGQQLSVSVVLKSFPSELPSDGSPLAKFAVEFLECDDGYYTEGSKSFWSSRGGSAIRKSVLSAAVRALSPSAPVSVSLEDSMDVSPSSLSFTGTISW